MTMGEKILNMRKARGWNQEELAERIGVTRQAVSRWEAGSAKPDADKIIAICDLFGVSADYLLRDRYSGEGSSLKAEKPPADALGEKVRSLDEGQRAACMAALIGGLILFALKLVYIFKNTNYTYYTANGTAYTGFQGFLMTEGLTMLWFPALTAFAAGILYLFVWPVIRKDKEKNGWPWERE